MNDAVFTIVIIDGDLCDLNELGTSVVRFDGLTRAEAHDLAEKSMAQGFCVAAWIAPREDAGCGQA